MSAAKRPASNSFGSSQMVVKRQKSNTDINGKAVAVTNGGSGSGALIQAVPRTSGLQAPIMELTGHFGEVFAVRFDPSGQYIASGSMDRSIMLWRTYGSCENYGILNGHKGAVLDLHWSRSSSNVFSASADTTLASWDLETGLRIRRHEGHEEIVNCLTASPRGEEILISGSDDGCVGIWDPRVKRAVDFIETDFPITSVAVAEAGNEIYTGGIDCDILAYDIRKKAVAYRMPGHTDTVTSLSISPDSQSLLSYSHDGLARTWDVRPFAPVDRSLKSFAGAPVGVERNLVRACWDGKGDRVGVGSGDGTVCVWEARTSKLVYKLPGHRGTVNDVRFAPGDEPIIVSGSSDRNLILGELGS
ncbi:hypothetical protein HO133_009262 [Letharia lupina]|uniref:Uncharacterized protein n=1 Tax=Letharia lupina TaxID=560253 RepID=A0A8H6CNL1_9LECA|nr:uncharacterized protein HO133_009262 [Letharia lupina]KAF6226396.1 hypothetical protein HO133_009262 [Letharia lupina]